MATLAVDSSDAFDLDESCDIPQQVWVWTEARVPALAQVLSVTKDHAWITVAIGAERGEHEETKDDSQDGSVPVETMPLEQSFQFDAGQLEDWDDAADMNALHEPALVELLRRRYAAGKIYTSCGAVLLSINPYRELPKLAEAPHPHAVATRALERLRQGSASQSILVNGESGAGKTEAAKLMIRQLAWESQQTHVADGASAVERCVVESNPLLEAFGNARTIRNDNSSRFGKFVAIQYDASGAITGAQTQHFLLETSRVVIHAAGERNYHIFYQLCAALCEHPLFASLQLGGGGDTFDMLEPGATEGGPERAEADLMAFADTVEALSAVGVTEDEVSALWGVLAGILHLGNIRFTVGAKDEAVLDETSPRSALGVSQACALLGIAREDLSKALVTRTIGGKASVVTIPLSPADAVHSRNGLAKAIYARTFDWLVARTNKIGGAAAGADATTRCIGILDIFGFEVLASNSFEQLCVNYANEVLQRLFNDHVARQESARYAEEGVICDCSVLGSNEAVIALLDGPRTGVFARLEEQAMLGDRASEAGFLAQLEHLQGDLFQRDRFGQPRFVVQHFAGPVEYDASGFLAKNNNALQGDLSDLLQVKATGNAFLRAELFPESAAAAAAVETGRARGGGGGGGRKIASLQSVSAQFRAQMSSLADALESTDMHFVRCIKPNDDKRPGDFRVPMVLDQLRHLGVMEAVRIRQEGFPVAQTFGSFLAEFSDLEPAQDAASAASPRDRCERLLQAALGEEAKSTWQVGLKEKVFMRKEVVPLLRAKLQALKQERQAAAKAAAKAEAEAEAARAEAAAAAATEAARAKAEAEAEAARAMAQAEAQAKAKAEAARAKAEAEAARAKAQAEAEAEAARAMAAKLQHETRKVTRIQAWWRKQVVRDHFLRLLDARASWKAVLRPNEAVLLASLVVQTSERELAKRFGLTRLSNHSALEVLLKSKKRRGLILTTGPTPRLLCVDPKTMAIMSEHDAKQVQIKELSDDKSFVILDAQETAAADNNVECLTDILGNSAPWARAIKRPMSVVELMQIGRAVRLDSTEPVVRQGMLKKRAIKSGKNWRDRWFVLQGSQLLWYKSQRQSTPQGAVELCETTTIQLQHLADRPFCFSVQSASIPEGLFIQCADKRDQIRWLAALTGVRASARLFR